jgi:hypothetical protein
MARRLVSLIANSRSNVCNCFSSCIRRVKSLEGFRCSRLTARPPSQQDVVLDMESDFAQSSQAAALMIRRIAIAS